MTLPAVKETVRNLAADVADHETRIRFLEKTIWWGAGACVGFGVILSLVLPKFIKAMGLGG